MKTINKLSARFMYPLEGLSLEKMDGDPLYPDAMSFGFPVAAGKHAVVRFSIQYAQVEKSWPDPSPHFAPSLDVAMDVIEEMYGMIAVGSMGAATVQMPEGEPEGFVQAVSEGGFALCPRDRGLAEYFYRKGLEFTNSNKERKAGE